MADRKSFLSLPSSVETDHKTNDSSSHENWLVNFGRRLSARLFSNRLPSVCYNNIQLREIPGSHRTSIFEAYSLKKNGLQFFQEKIDKYNSRLYKFSIGKPSVIICDSDAACQSCCDASKIFKEPIFGRKKVNLFIIGNHTPCMFTNDFVHARRKAFLKGLITHVMKTYLLPILVEVIPQHMKNWNTEESKRCSLSFEERIMRLMCTIYSRVFLGISLEHTHMLLWIKHIFKIPKDKNSVMEAYRSMFNAAKRSPRLEEILVIGQKYKISPDEMINEVLFTILFNGFPASAFALISCIGRLDAMEMEQRQLLREEVNKSMQNGINWISVAKLQQMEDFILEVVRLTPPAPFVFGIARNEFVIFSSSGNFKVNEGDALAGSLYECHRDPDLFDDASEFKPSRFVDESLKDCILTFGGRYTDDARSGNRKCPGQDMAMTVVKACLVNILSCDCKLEEPATFEAKSFDRLGMPDTPIALEKFKFNLPEFWRLSPVSDIIIEESSSSNSICPRHFNGRISALSSSSGLSDVDI